MDQGAQITKLEAQINLLNNGTTPGEGPNNDVANNYVANSDVANSEGPSGGKPRRRKASGKGYRARGGEVSPFSGSNSGGCQASAGWGAGLPNDAGSAYGAAPYGASGGRRRTRRTKH